MITLTDDVIAKLSENFVRGGRALAVLLLTHQLRPPTKQSLIEQGLKYGLSRAQITEGLGLLESVGLLQFTSTGLTLCPNKIDFIRTPSVLIKYSRSPDEPTRS